MSRSRRRIGIRLRSALPPAAAVLAACALCTCQRGAEAPPPTPPRFQGELVGQRLPEWEIREWVIDPDPELRRSREHPLVIVFWNTGDATSDEALSLVQTLAVELNHRGLRAVTIHTDVGFDEAPHRSRIQEYLDERGFILPTAIDKGNTTLAKFRLYDVPSLLYVDDEGIVRGMTSNYRVSKNDDVSEFVRSALLGITPAAAPAAE